MARVKRAEIYRTGDGVWYWQLRGIDNEVIVVQGGGYEQREQIVHMLEKHYPQIAIVDLEEARA